MKGFESAFAAERRAVNAALREIRAARGALFAGPLREAVDYALAGEGKRVRGVLLMVSHQAAGGSADVSMIAAAVEVVHAYSLVHDDLPCMDDDALRRGIPTLHRKFGPEVATATGIAMVPLAVLAVLDGVRRAQLPRDAAPTIVNELMRAAGAEGMIGGQVLDLDAEGRSLTLDELDQLHGSKTGALFAASARIGGITAAADAARVAALTAFGRALGLGFQILDDVLDVTATSAQLGKDAGRDEALHKSTYPGAVGVEEASRRARAVVIDATSALHASGVKTARLEQLAAVTATRSA